MYFSSKNQENFAKKTKIVKKNTKVGFKDLFQPVTSATFIALGKNIS